MRLSSNFTYFVFIYLIHRNKWVFVESTDTSAVSSPSSVACADLDSETGGSDSGLTASGETACSGEQGSTSGAVNGADGSSDDQVSTSGAAIEGLAAGEPAEVGSLATSELKVFKDDPDGNKVEMEASDLSQGNYSGYLIYEFKPNVQCTLVKVEEKDVWKNGDQNVDIPISVSYNPDTHKVVLFKSQKSVFYKKDNSGNWVNYHTIDGFTLNHTDHSSSQAYEAEPESGSDAGLRGTSAPTEAPKEVEETSSLASVGADTSEETEKEASSDPDGISGGLASGESADPGLVFVSSSEAGEAGSTSGSDSSPTSTDASAEGSVAAPTNEASTSGGSTGEGAGADAAENSTAQLAGGDADESGTHTGEDGGTQPSTGAPTSDGTYLTSVPDESSNGSPEDGGSSTTPLHSSGRVGGTPSQDGTATPTAGSTDTATKTGVELSLKATAATNEFDYEAVDECVTFTAKDNYAFNVVKEDDTEIWRTDTEIEYSTEVILNPKGKDDRAVTIYLLNNTIKVFRRNAIDKTWTECTQFIKLFKVDPNDSTNTVELDSSDYKYEFDGEHLYGFYSGVKCSLLKIKDKDVWKYDLSKHNGKYPKIVEVMKETIFIYFEGRTEVYFRVGDNYKIGEFTREKAAEIDIKKDYGTNEFYYNKFGDIAKYTPKGGHFFNLVKQGEEKLWIIDNVSEYAIKVVLSGDDKKDKIVTIHMSNGIIKVFRRNAMYKLWTECTQYIKLFKADPNDATKTVELDTRDYKYKFEGEHVYEFKDGVNCTLIKIKGKDVWNYDSSKHNGKYPKSVGVMKETIFIHFEGCFEVYFRDGDNYKIRKFTQGKAVELDIKKDAGTDEFGYNKVGKVVTFTAKDNYAFNVVKQDKTEIWKTYKESEYAIKVALSGKGKHAKSVTITLLDGTKKAYKKDGSNKPWNEVEPPAEDTASTPSSTPASSATPTAGGANQGPDGTSSGRGTGQSTDGPGATHTGGESGDGQGGVTTPPAKGGSTHTRGGSGGGGGGGGTPARQPKDTEQATYKITVTELTPEEYPQDIKLLKPDPDGDNDTVVLLNSEYSVKKYDEAHLYEFESGVKCTLIKHEDKEVWKYDSAKHNGKYPKGINVDKKFFSIFFEGCTVIYAKITDGWTVCVESTINLKWAKSLRDKTEILDVPIYFMID